MYNFDFRKKIIGVIAAVPILPSWILPIAFIALSLRFDTEKVEFSTQRLRDSCLSAELIAQVTAFFYESIGL